MPWYFHILLYSLGFYLVVCIVYYLIQEKLVFVHRHLSDFRPYAFTVSFSQRVFKTPNDGVIHGLLFKVKKPKGLIFYLHGNTGSINRWGYMAEELSDFGFDVFVMDYRGYGKSRGRKKEKWMHDDVLFCYNELIKEYSEKRVVVYGRSLGTGFAVRLASQTNIDHLILETPFYSLVDVAERTLPFLPMKLLLRYKFYSNIYMGAVRCPITIFHGTKDLIVSYNSAFKLYEKYKNELELDFITLVGGKHNNINTYALYREKIQEITNQLDTE